MIRHRSAAWERGLLSSWPGRLALTGAAIKLVLLAVPSEGRLPALLDSAATLALAVALGYFFVQLLVRLQRRLLWRVRRKLILSYVFVGFIPVFLIVAFFAVAGAMSVLSTSSDLVRRELETVVSDASLVASVVSGRLSAGADESVALEPIDRDVILTYPALSAVVVSTRPGTSAVPGWIGDGGFSGIVQPPTVSDGVTIVARAVRRVDGPADRVVVVDIPLGPDVMTRIEQAIGVQVYGSGTAPSRAEDPTRFASTSGLAWVAFLEPTDWTSGEVGSLNLDIRVPLGAFYQQLFGLQAQIGDVSFQYIFLILLTAIGGLFLIIEFAALVMGFALARSITGSVHELFTGTERVRRGDFGHRIRIESGDQLGDLAESFNAMTASVEGLLQQAAEKKRLEDELRIARQIQMSLLPRDAASIPGLSLTAVCRPAREVGGDYYDFIRLGERRLGLLVADVSGKGTSAALYMAELKGLILSLGQIHESPKQLLVEVNRIMASNLDSRSFITMIYVVVDLHAGTLTYARAGHTPLIYLAHDSTVVRAQALAPDGMVLGLDGYEQQFEALLEERCLPIATGDLVLLFTDGITEAMNEEDDLFGEARLCQLLEEHRHLASEELREYILRDIEAFVGTADQHDDMTMVLLRIDDARSDGESESQPSV